MLPNPNSELPPPKERLTTTPSGGEEKYVVSPEQVEQVAPGERLIKANDAIAQATTDPQVLVAATQQQVADDAVVTANDDALSPKIADDVDVIEKEWVQKAKNIVEKTKDDPNQQSNQLAGLKKEYKTNRFGVKKKLLDQQTV